jgi:hypothetical protein
VEIASLLTGRAMALTQDGNGTISTRLLLHLLAFLVMEARHPAEHATSACAVALIVHAL